jgi:protein TonB
MQSTPIPISEEKNKRVAVAVTVVLHMIILLLCIFALTWMPPDPPWSEYGSGVELNFGLDAAGSGNIQTLADANPSKNTEDSKPAAANSEPVSPQDQPVEEVQESAPEPKVPESVATSEEESPVEVKEKPEPKKVETPKIVEKPVPNKEDTPAKVEEKIAPAKPEPKIDKRAVMVGGGGNGNSGTSNTPTGNNNGDKPGKVGDQGDPRGTLNGKALYGDPGTGGGTGGGNGTGSSVNITGWVADFQPKIDKDLVEEGRVVFKVKIDQDGNIISVVPIEKRASQATVEICKREVEKMTFSTTAENPNPAPTSTGTVTFIIRSR